MKSKGAKHHAYPQGTLVRVVMRDGTTVYGRFKEKNRRYCILEGKKRIPWSKVHRFVQVSKVVTHCDPVNGTG